MVFLPLGMLRDAQSRAESADVDAKRRSRTKGEYHEEKGWVEDGAGKLRETGSLVSVERKAEGSEGLRSLLRSLDCVDSRFCI